MRALRAALALVAAALVLAGCGAAHHKRGPVWVTPTVSHQLAVCEGAGCGIYSVSVRWHIHWTGHAATGYYVYINGTQQLVGGNPENVTTQPWVVGSLDCGTTYTFGVRAHDSTSPTPLTSAISTTSYTTPACPGSTTTSSTTTSSTSTASCTTNVTTSTFASAVTAASAGATLCLASGSYGTFSGTNKAITITPASGATVTMSLNFGSGDSSFTIDGSAGGGALTIPGGEITDVSSGITLRNATFTDSVVIDDGLNMGLTFDHDSFNSEDDNSGCTDDPARIHVAYNDGGNSGITVENSQFVDPSGGLDNAKDGIQTGEGMVIRNNEFENIIATVDGCNHSDAVQSVDATGVTVVGNLFINDADGFANFDGAASDTITDNACETIQRDSCISLYSDNGSTVNHNTMADGASVEIDRKTADPAGTGTIVENNVGDIIISDGSTVATQTHNLYSGATSPDINGTPTFAGGSTPSTWGGFELTSGSAGHAAGTDGADVGIRASAGGPPADVGVQ